MIESLIQTGVPAAEQGSAVPAPRKRFHMGSSDRMAGSVPVWEYGSSVRNDITDNLAAAGKHESFSDALAYADQQAENKAAEPRDFGFGDLVDIINPLQHIPLIGNIYRALTGDEIAPASQIIGSTVYGGFIGAASGIANVIIEQETGKDISGNMLAMIRDGDTPSYKNKADPVEQDLERALAQLDNPDPGLTTTALGFAPADNNDKSGDYERVPAADGRTAGTIVRKKMAQADTTGIPVMAREPITQVTLSPIPLRQEDRPIALSPQTKPFPLAHK
ncbi:MAG: hypothetical protein H6868_01810 [Rhodospirillales bacterium]|nr:hypothetical protein [Rhodospirillales bacterium]